MSYVKIHPHKITYYRDGNNIVAKMTDCTLDLLKSMQANKEFIYDDGIRNLFLNDSYTGVARFDGATEFDEEVGRAIARKRCVRKYRKAIHNAYVRYMSKQIAYMSNSLKRIAEDYALAEEKYNTIEKDFGKVQ